MNDYNHFLVIPDLIRDPRTSAVFGSGLQVKPVMTAISILIGEITYEC